MDAEFAYETLFEDEFKARLAEEYKYSMEQMLCVVIHSTVIRLQEVFAGDFLQPRSEVDKRQPLYTYTLQLLEGNITPEALRKAQEAAKIMNLFRLAEVLPRFPEYRLKCEQKIRKHYHSV